MSNYFYSQEAEQFTFYRIPKALFSDDKYKKMSTDAKVLYGLLLDRVSLSIKNDWIDKQNRVYIIFTRNEAQELLNFGNQKITKLFKELNNYDLLEEIKQGLNKPNILYVKKFIKTIENTKTCENHMSEDVVFTRPKVLKSHAIYTEFNNTDFNDTQSVVKKDRQTDTIETQLNQIIEQAEINLYKGQAKELLEITIKKLLQLKELKIKNTIIEKQQIYQQLLKIDINTCDYALSKFRQVQQERTIKNKSNYFMTLLYTAIDEVVANNIY